MALRMFMAQMALVTDDALVILQALQQKSSHVPFRNSKLTRLLEDSVGFNSRTMVVLTCRFVKLLASLDTITSFGDCVSASRHAACGALKPNVGLELDYTLLS